MIKIVFFDGDGTLWYPKSTKHTKKPHWIYADEKHANDYLQHMVLTPKVKSTLEKLRKNGIITVALSTHPQPKEEADALLKAKVKYFGLENLFDEVFTARNVASGKGDVIKEVLKRHEISGESAIHIGDSYRWDYVAARNVGARAIIMDTGYLNEYAKDYPEAAQIQEKAVDVGQLFDFIKKW